MKKRLLVLIIIILAAFSAGCSSESNHKSESNDHDHVVRHLPNGDIQETTSSLDELPTFLATLSEPIQQTYQLVASEYELLEWIPCYCGCGESAGHLNSKNCFIKEVHSDGSVVWDDHGTRCGVCLQIALKSVQLKKQGKSNLEIRNYIDESYKEGFAKPTPTPMPS